MKCPSCGQENRQTATFCDGCGLRLAALSDKTSSRTADSNSVYGASTFIGRQREMDELKRLLDDAFSGRGRLVMLVGEPGIGKTRTAQELADDAQMRGAQVWWGRCYEEQGMPPYWPWVQAMRSYIREQDPEQLQLLMGDGASYIGGILPDVKSKLPDLPAPPALDSPEYARFRLFDSVAAFLKAVAQAQPLVLVLDDLHWADQPSLMFLQFVATQMSDCRLLVLGAYRDVELSRQHPLSETLAQLTREPVFQRVLLRGLSQDDTRRFVEVKSGVRPSAGLVQAIYARAEGNPFYMAEVVRLLQEQGELSEERAGGPQGIRIPDGVREVIGQRLNRLSDLCNQALTEASVIGREFTLAQLGHLIEGVSETQLLDTLDEALAAHVVEELPQAVGRYQFTHALVQETLLQEVTLTRRVRLHARIAEALEDLYGVDAEGHAAELAHHFGEARTLLGLERFIKYSLMAGEQALAAYAWEEALAHFQRALETKEGQQPTDAETAALLFGLGRAQLATVQSHDLGEVVATLRRAFDYYAEVGDVSQAVAVAQSPVQAAPLSGHRTGMVDLISRALALVSPGSHEAGRLLCQYGNTVYYEAGEYSQAQEAFVQALAIAQREGDVSLEMRTLVAAGHAEAYQLHFQDTLRYDLQAIELASRVNDPFEETHARQELASVFHRTGHLEEARRQATTMLAVAERLRHRTRLWQALQANTAVAFLEGNWQSARAFSDRALSVSPRNPNLLGYRSVIDYSLGDNGPAGKYLDQLLEVMQRTSPGPTFEYVYPAIVIPLVAHISGLEHQLEVAGKAAQAVLSSPTVTPVFACLAQSGLALLAVRETDKVAADEIYRALRSQRGVMLGGPLDSIMSLDRLLGLLAQTRGDLDSGAAHFQDALTFCRQAGYPPELAWSLCEYAGLLLQRSTTDDRTTASSLLEESLAISSELGMCPLMERVVVLQQQLHPQPEPTPAFPAGLTEREVEILRLVAAGKSNPEIAEDLYISSRTVSTHVSNILNKTNAANRAEATAYAVRSGLV